MRTHILVGRAIRCTRPRKSIVEDLRPCNARARERRKRQRQGLQAPTNPLQAQYSITNARSERQFVTRMLPLRENPYDGHTHDVAVGHEPGRVSGAQLRHAATRVRSARSAASLPQQAPGQASGRSTDGSGVTSSRAAAGRPHQRHPRRGWPTTSACCSDGSNFLLCLVLIWLHTVARSLPRGPRHLTDAQRLEAKVDRSSHDVGREVRRGTSYRWAVHKLVHYGRLASQVQMQILDLGRPIFRDGDLDTAS